MAVLDITRTRIEPPATLPVDYLSWSSIRTFLMCPEKWRRRYIDHEPEPASGKMLLGSSAGAALAQHYGTQIETGQGISPEQLIDEFATEFEHRIENEEVDLEGENPGKLIDTGVGALRLYHRAIAPTVKPATVEREFALQWDGLDWTLTGYLDLEETSGRIRDYKMTGQRIGKPKADADLQAGVYLLAARAEGSANRELVFDAMIRTVTPRAEPVQTSRTDTQLDLVTERIFRVAAEIDWRCQTGNWGAPAPGTWFCSTCRYHDCPWRIS